MIVRAWLERAASARPNQTALEAADGGCSYAELYAGASAGATELRRNGIERGSRVAILLPAGLGFVRALHACLLVGAVAVPVDPRLADAERDRVLAGAELVLDEPLPAVPERFAGSDDHPPRHHDLDATAVVIHTSGTTAAPRAVELTYGNLLWSALGSAAALGVDADERWLCALPLSHVGGLSILVRSAIYGTTAVLHDRFDTDAALAAIEQGPITLISVVATTLARLLDAGLERPRALRCALTGGGPVPRALVERAHEAGVPVSLTYGLTETSSQVTTTPMAELGDAPAEPGPALFCTQVRIAPDDEILVRGPTVAVSAATADGWLATGDLGRLDAGGRLHVSGRKADTIVTGGENVAPAEVEAVLEAHPKVLEAGVVGRPHEQWGEMVAAWVVSDERLDWDELVEHCRRHLASYKIPKEFHGTSDRLPRTASGKLLRRELA